MNKKNKIFVVYQLQRWDVVQLIRGYEDEEEAEKLRSSLEEKEDRFDETYSVAEIEIEIKKVKIAVENITNKKPEKIDCPNCKSGKLLIFEIVKNKFEFVCNNCNKIFPISGA